MGMTVAFHAIYGFASRTTNFAGESWNFWFVQFFNVGKQNCYPPERKIV